MIVGGANPRREHLGADRLPRILDALHRGADRLAAPRDRSSRRAGCVHRGDLVAERAAFEIRPDRHRDHGVDRLRGRLAVPAHVPAERARYGREHDVVDRPAEGVFDLLNCPEAPSTQVKRRCGPSVRRTGSAEPPGRRARVMAPSPRRGAAVATGPLGAQQLPGAPGDLAGHRGALEQRVG